jgi:hypothetical protein
MTATACLHMFLCSARAPFLRPGLRFEPRRAQRRSSEERSNPEPRAAPYSEHGEDCEHRTLTGASTTRRLPLAGTSSLSRTALACVVLMTPSGDR